MFGSHRSCFPQTIINRVLHCGLKDFFAHSPVEPSAALNDLDLPKMPSVAGILSHLGIQHGEDIRRAMWILIKVTCLLNSRIRHDDDELFSIIK